MRQYIFQSGPEISNPPKHKAELSLYLLVAGSLLTVNAWCVWFALTGRNDSGEENVPLDLSRGG